MFKLYDKDFKLDSSHRIRRDIAKYLNTSPSHISQALKNHGKAKGFYIINTEEKESVIRFLSAMIKNTALKYPEDSIKILKETLMRFKDMR